MTAWEVKMFKYYHNKAKAVIKKAFEVKPLTAEEALEVSEEFKRGEHYSI